MFKRLKQEQFKDATQTQMLRYIIEQGLASVKGEQSAQCDAGRGSV